MNKFQLLLCCLTASTILSACSWDTYTKEDGSTGLRPTNSFGQSVYYEDGTYSRNQRYNEYRPVRRVLNQDNPVHHDERVRWQ